MNALAIPLLVMLLLVVADAVLLRRFRGEHTPWSDVIFNLNSGHILLWFFRGIEVAVFAFVLAHFSTHWADHWPPVLVWVFAFFAWDFCFYWLHRLHHKIPLFWAVHVVHHEGEHFNLSLGIRNSWYSSLTSIPFFAVLAVIGVPVSVFIVVSSLHYSIQFYNHCGTLRSSGWLDKFMVTPLHHRVHHGMNPEYIDKNFSGTLLIWDKLFGTFQRELPGVPIHYGVEDSVPTHNPFWANNLPFVRFLKWRQPALAAVTRPSMPEHWIALGGLFLFGAVIYYVHRQGTWQGTAQLSLFALIFLSTLALGGISDGRRWGMVAWSVLTVASPVVMMGWYGLRQPWGCLPLILLALHGLMSLGWWLAHPPRLQGSASAPDL
jgi:sterol desaturase/sphingolipid hydroxylase (fatty acid hydroxylase superfamily)